MRMWRIGGKLISEEKLFTGIEGIMDDREAGATQSEAAELHHVQRSFVSFLETLGEVRRGSRVAIIAFPVSNAKEIEELAERYSIDMVLALSQEAREKIEGTGAEEIFNALMATMEELAQFDAIIVCASDLRIASSKRIFGPSVFSIELGKSPLRSDVELDLAQLEELICSLLENDDIGTQPRWAVGPSQKRTDEIVRRWR